MTKNRSCSNCIKGVAISVNSDILCRDKGVVSRDFVCSKHRSTPATKTATRELNFKCVHCENFVINAKSSESSSSIGLCQLFSARQYIGEEKNACSKFVKRSESITA